MEARKPDVYYQSKLDELMKNSPDIRLAEAPPPTTWVTASLRETIAMAVLAMGCAALVAVACGSFLDEIKSRHTVESVTETNNPQETEV